MPFVDVYPLLFVALPRLAGSADDGINHFPERKVVHPLRLTVWSGVLAWPPQPPSRWKTCVFVLVLYSSLKVFSHSPYRKPL